MRKITLVVGVAATQLVSGVAASALANAGTKADQHSVLQAVSCPGGYRSQSVPVNGYTLWTCAKKGKALPGATATVTQTETVTAPAKTITIRCNALNVCTTALAASVVDPVTVTVTAAPSTSFGTTSTTPPAGG